MGPKVRVVATTFDGTRAALLTAIPLARGLETGVVVVVPQLVSGAAELDGRTPAAESMAKRYRDIAHTSGAEADVDVFTSNSLDGLLKRLCAEPGAIVVGGPVGRWLTSPEERVANRLALAGCQVLFVASGPNSTQRRVAA